MSVGGNFRGSGFSGTDRPDGLISDEDLGKLLRGQTRGCALAVIENDGLGLPAFAMFESFADADNGCQADVESCDGFLEHDLIALAEVLAALAVSDDYAG